MIEVRPFGSLGHFQNEWLNARHHFSFGEYHDPARMGFGRLRVWNDDEVAPGHGLRPASAPGDGDRHLCPRRARSPIATASATRAGPRPGTCR